MPFPVAGPRYYAVSSPGAKLRVPTLGRLCAKRTGAARTPAQGKYFRSVSLVAVSLSVTNGNAFR